MSAVTLVLSGWLVMAAVMAVLWVVQRARRDAGVVDVGWAAGLGLLAVLYAVLGVRRSAAARCWWPVMAARVVAAPGVVHPRQPGDRQARGRPLPGVAGEVGRRVPRAASSSSSSCRRWWT